MGLNWTGKQLCVCASYTLEHDDWTSDVAVVVLGCMRWQKYSDSRWLTVGSCSRSLVASLLAGVLSLVSYVQRDPQVSLYYLNGFDRLSRSVREFVAVASDVALVPLVPDALLSHFNDTC
eukprot:5904996-Amphidinium_carterae.2